jgi:hypothetical protein
MSKGPGIRNLKRLVESPRKVNRDDIEPNIPYVIIS